MIRFVISDADGTLVCKEKLIDARAFAHTFHTLGARGIPLCIASGRTYPALRRLFAPYANGLLYFPLDGAVAVGGSEILCSFPLSNRAVSDGLKLLSLPYVRGVEFCTLHHSYPAVNDSALIHSELARLGEECIPLRTAHADGIDALPAEPIYKIIVFTRPTSSAIPLPHDTRAVYQSAYVTELVRTDVSKRRAAEITCESLHISADEILALGDGENDRELLSYAGTAVTIYGAPHHVFSLTKHHTQNAARAILRFLNTDTTGKDG